MAELLPGVPDDMEHITRIHGEINGQKVDFVGGGLGQPYNGTVRTELTSEIDLPIPTCGFSPIAIMGYPTYSKYQTGATDLFKRSDGYVYRRNFHYSCGGVLRTEHNIKRDGDKLDGDFAILEGRMEFPEVVSIEQCIETFQPGGPGRITSTFRARWKTASGEDYWADVENEYVLNHDMELPGPHFRLIKIDPDCAPRSLVQHESLTVVSDLSAVREGLQ